MNFETYIYSISGGRSYNEDSAEVKELSNGILCVLADGLGGHRYGELASKCVTETFINSKAPVGDREEIKEWFENQIEAANSNILELQKEKSCTMKSTAVILATIDENAYWANVGDSRLYYIHNKELQSITEDHSVAYKKYRAGEITREQIGSDEDQSRLLRALGGSDRYQPDFNFASEPLEKGDGFVLCSDGLWEYVYDNEILFDFLKSDSAQEWAELLLRRAMERIQPDNDNLSLITVLLK